jgi:hypothetical protein
MFRRKSEPAKPTLDRPSPTEMHLWDDEMEECRPPRGEVVEWHLTYTAEAYLPSHVPLLRERLDELDWIGRHDQSADDLLRSMREGPYGGGWSALATLEPESSTTVVFGPGRRRAPLPDGVSVALLTLQSITPSLTVLVMCVVWDEYWGDALDRIAKTDYTTAWIPAGDGRTIYSPWFRKRLEAKRRRSEMHRRIEWWLTERVPGAFRELARPLPTVDIITSARARPFMEEPPLQMWDYREALALDRTISVAESASLPNWRLALPSMGNDFLTLTGRTVEVFNDKAFGSYGDPSRWGLAAKLQFAARDLVSAWAAGQVLEGLHSALASARDKPPETNESDATLARRLGNEVPRALTLGADAGAYCFDILNLPQWLRPLRVLAGLDFVVHRDVPGHELTPLREEWDEWLKLSAKRVSQVEQEQRARLVTSVEVRGIAQNIKAQSQLRWLTGTLLVFTVALVAVAVLQAVKVI